MAASQAMKMRFVRALDRGCALSVEGFTNALLSKFAQMGTSASEALTVFKAMALEAFNRMKARTPVDTGFARSGWRIKAENWTKEHVVIEIWNEVSYIIFLEYGWSKKAPLGMLRITLEEMSHRLRTGRGLPREAAFGLASLDLLKANRGGWKD